MSLIQVLSSNNLALHSLSATNSPRENIITHYISRISISWIALSDHRLLFFQLTSHCHHLLDSTRTNSHRALFHGSSPSSLFTQFKVHGPVIITSLPHSATLPPHFILFNSDLVLNVWTQTSCRPFMLPTNHTVFLWATLLPSQFTPFLLVPLTLLPPFLLSADDHASYFTEQIKQLEKKYHRHLPPLLSNFQHLHSWTFLPGISYSMICQYIVQKTHESQKIVFIINHKLYLLL